MSKKKNGYPKPRWLNFVPPKWISSDTKRLYTYLCVFGPDSCDHWNCRLAKKFYVSTRTIARRLRKLRELGLVWVANPQSPYRVLHPLYYGKIEDWLLAAQRKKIGDSLSKMGTPPRVPLGQKCPSESERDKLLSLPSKERAKTTGTDYLDRPKKRRPVKDIHPDIEAKAAKDKIYWLWVSYFQAKGYNDLQSTYRAAQQTAQGLAPPD